MEVIFYEKQACFYFYQNFRFVSRTFFKKLKQAEYLRPRNIKARIIMNIARETGT